MKIVSAVVVYSELAGAEDGQSTLFVFESQEDAQEYADSSPLRVDIYYRIPLIPSCGEGES